DPAALDARPRHPAPRTAGGDRDRLRPPCARAGARSGPAQAAVRAARGRDRGGGGGPCHGGHSDQPLRRGLPRTAAHLPRPAAQQPGTRTGLVGLLGSVAELDAQIEPEKNPSIKGSLLLKRGALNSRLARWRQAADDFRRAAQLDPNADWTWYYAIVTLVEIGERAGYRDLCQQMHLKFEMSPDPLLAERIAKLWLLSPECPGDPAIPPRLIDRALAEGPNQKLYYWVMSTKGLSEYRAGDFDEAASWLRKGIDAAPAKAPQCKALSGLFLSMTLRRQDR